MVERVDQASAYRAYGAVNGGSRSSMTKKDNADPGVYFEMSDALKADKKEQEKSVRPASLQPVPKPAVEKPEPEQKIDTAAEKSSIPAPDFRAILNRVTGFFKTLTSRLGTMIAGFWNGTDAEAKANADEASAIPAIEDNDGRTGEVISGEVEYLPRTSDMKAIREYMKDYGGRHLAVNSDLLTSYDRYGRIVKHNPSDADRLLRESTDQLIDTGKGGKK